MQRFTHERNYVNGKHCADLALQKCRKIGFT